MRAGSYAALAIAAYLAFLVATVPAAFVSTRLQGAARGLEISDPQGTIWRGSARMRGVVGATVVTVNALHWRWLPTRVLHGEIAYRTNIELPGFVANLDVARSLAGWEIRNLDAAGDASALGTFVPLLAPWRPAGPTKVSASRIALRGDNIEGDARIEWRRATTGLSDVRPVGSYEGVWRGQGAAGRVEVRTLDGPLRITGEGLTSIPLRMSFTGEARGEGERAKELEPLLDLMGPRRPDGSRSLQVVVH
jgi:general secretion pathway protein N